MKLRGAASAPLITSMTKMRLASVSLAFCLAVLSAATTQAAKPAPPKPVKAKAPKVKAPPKGKASSKLKARVPAQTWRNRQITPSKDRYLEIQQALYEQGYLPAAPSGVWNQESVDALRQFQSD